MRITVFFFLNFFSYFINAQQWQWAKTIDSTLQNPNLNCLAVDHSTNFYLSTNFSTGTSIAKFDSQGNEIWRKTITGDIAINGIEYRNNELFITGSFQNAFQLGSDSLISSGGYDIYVAALTSTGNFIWARKFGGPQYDEGNGLCTDANGNIYLTGSYSGTANFGTSTFVCQGYNNMFIMKMDFIGNVLFAKSAGCIDSSGSSSGTKIKTDSGGNIFILGQFRDIILDSIHVAGNYFGASSFLAKLNSMGSTNWVKLLSSNSASTLNDIAIDNAGNILTSGEGSWHDGWTLTQKYNTLGILLWDRTIEGYCDGDSYSTQSIALVNNNSYQIGSAVRSNCSPTQFKALLRLEFDEFGNILFRDTTQANSVAPNDCLYSLKIIVDSNSDIIICGTLIYGSIILGADSLSAFTGKVFIAKFYQNNVTSIPQNTKNSTAPQIYPNPISEVFQISFNSFTTSNAVIKIINTNGQNVYHKTFLHLQNNSTFTESIDLNNTAKGIYFVEIITDNERTVKKILLE